MDEISKVEPLFYITRRDLIKSGIGGALLLSPVSALAKPLFSTNKNVKQVTENDAPKKLWRWSKEVYFQEELKNNYVKCLTCPNECILAPDARSR